MAVSRFLYHDVTLACLMCVASCVCVCVLCCACGSCLYFVRALGADDAEWRRLLACLLDSDNQFELACSLACMILIFSMTSVAKATCLLPSCLFASVFFLFLSLFLSLPPPSFLFCPLPLCSLFFGLFSCSSSSVSFLLSSSPPSLLGVSCLLVFLPVFSLSLSLLFWFFLSPLSFSFCPWPSCFRF